MTEIDGLVEPGFGAVADAFSANFARHDDVGAGFCLYADGRKVVDLVGGVADPQTGRAYGDDTLQLVFSTTKGAAAICAAILHDRGQLDYDAPVAQYWPEFAAAGKGDLTVGWMMSHRCGLVTVDDPPPLEDVLAVEPIVEALAAQAPLWEPDGTHGYHALTYGWLVAEVVRRITGQRLGDFWQEQVARPLGLDFWIGLPAEHEPRVAPLLRSTRTKTLDPAVRARVERFMGPETLLGKALGLSGTFGSFGGERADLLWNSPEVWASEIPAANGITNAASLARLYAATLGSVDGVRLFGDTTRELATTPVTTGGDRCLYMETKFGMGFMCADGVLPLAGPRSFGHAGAGGSIGYADPDLGVGYGYVMNHMTSSLLGDPRTSGLTDAVKRCLR